MANSADPDQLASSEARTYPGSAGLGLSFKSSRNWTWDWGEHCGIKLLNFLSECDGG